MNSSKNSTCPSGKLRTEFTSPIAKSTSSRLSDTTFFVRCDLIVTLPSQGQGWEVGVLEGWEAGEIGGNFAAMLNIFVIIIEKGLRKEAMKKRSGRTGL